jgi:hypothetical protein
MILNGSCSKNLNHNFINYNDSEWFAAFAKTKGCGAPPFVAAPQPKRPKENTLVT